MEKTMVLAKTAEKPNYESEILRIIRGNTSPKAMLNQLEDYHGSDIADVIEQLSEQERKKVFRICPAEMLAEAFAHLEEEKAGECLKEISPRKAGEIVSEMETDDAVEILHTIGREKRELILDALDEDIKKEIRLIASFDEDEIGSRMTTNCIILARGSDGKGCHERAGQTGGGERQHDHPLCGGRDGLLLRCDRSERPYRGEERCACWKASLPHRSPMCTPTRPSTTASNS